jgi:hypothetical protein
MVGPVVGRHVPTEKEPRIAHAPVAFHVERGTSPLSARADLSPRGLVLLTRVRGASLHHRARGHAAPAAGGSPSSALTATTRSAYTGVST